MPRLDYVLMEELVAQRLAEAMDRGDAAEIDNLRAELRKIAAVTLPRRRFTTETCSRIVQAAELRVAGLSWYEIADRLGDSFAESLRKPGRYKDALRVEEDTLRLSLTLPHNRRD